MYFAIWTRVLWADLVQFAKSCCPEVSVADVGDIFIRFVATQLSGSKHVYEFCICLLLHILYTYLYIYICTGDYGLHGKIPQF